MTFPQRNCWLILVLGKNQNHLTEIEEILSNYSDRSSALWIVRVDVITSTWIYYFNTTPYFLELWVPSSLLHRHKLLVPYVNFTTCSGPFNHCKLFDYKYLWIDDKVHALLSNVPDHNPLVDNDWFPQLLRSCQPQMPSRPIKSQWRPNPLSLSLS